MGAEGAGATEVAGEVWEGLRPFDQAETTEVVLEWEARALPVGLEAVTPESDAGVTEMVRDVAVEEVKVLSGARYPSAPVGV